MSIRLVGAGDFGKVTITLPPDAYKQPAKESTRRKIQETDHLLSGDALEKACCDNPRSAILRARLGMAYAMNFDFFTSRWALEAAIDWHRCPIEVRRVPLSLRGCSYDVVVFMSIATTVVGPPLLKIAYKRVLQPDATPLAEEALGLR
jgi:hypothetical protein